MQRPVEKLLTYKLYCTAPAIKNKKKGEFAFFPPSPPKMYTCPKCLTSSHMAAIMGKYLFGMAEFIMLFPKKINKSYVPQNGATEKHNSLAKKQALIRVQKNKIRMVPGTR